MKQHAVCPYCYGELENGPQALCPHCGKTLPSGYGKDPIRFVPVVGAVGGAADAVCLGRVRRYAAIKYRKRFLIRRRAGGLMVRE